VFFAAIQTERQARLGQADRPRGVCLALGAGTSRSAGTNAVSAEQLSSQHCLSHAFLYAQSHTKMKLILFRNKNVTKFLTRDGESRSDAGGSPVRGGLPGVGKALPESHHSQKLHEKFN